MKPKICIVGSANIDQIAYVEKTPADGETVFGNSYQMGFGGKGANQAVMAGILGAEVYMVCCLGSDVYKDMTIENFKKNNVKTDYIQTVKGSSGVAPIWVDSSGQNRIIVIPGANDLINTEQTLNSLEAIGKIDVLVGQFEIPMNVTELVFEYAFNKGVQTILNPAPANKPTKKLLQSTSWFIPNEIEFEEIFGAPFNEENLFNFSGEIDSKIIVTLGEKGCAFINNGKVEILGTKHVTAIDTTGAGDAFVGAFSYALGLNLSIVESLQLALEKATDSVTRKGTQSSYKN